MSLISTSKQKILHVDGVSTPCQRLVLGAAQFGMPYGVANITGQPDSSTVTGIVSAVWSRGVRFFDTAQVYGKSEEALGQALMKLSICGEASVVSKLKPVSEAGDRKEITQCIHKSLERLRVQRLWGILLHQEKELDRWDDFVGQALLEAKRSGLVCHVGVSVYSPERALQALEISGLDLVQMPANVFDRRMERAGVFARARELGKTVFVRSIYLQGLALMAPDTVPRGISRGREAAKAFQEFCGERQIDAGRLAIDFVRHMDIDAKLIIGAETVTQAVANCALVEKEPLDEEIYEAWRSRWPDDFESLIDPRKWSSSN